MAIITKPKLKIGKKYFYILIFLIFLYVMAQTLYLLSSLIINTTIFDNIADVTEKNNATVKWMTGKIISYLVNIILVLVFMLYLAMARHKMQLGFIFLIWWVMVFIALTAGMHILSGSHDEPVRLGSGVVGSISAGIIVVTLMYLGKELIILRKIRRKELYKIFKKKGSING